MELQLTIEDIKNRGIPVYRKVLDKSIEVSVERLKGTPLLYLVVKKGGEPFFVSKPFFTDKSFPEDDFAVFYDEISREFEKRDIPMTDLGSLVEWQSVFSEVKKNIPERPIMPSVDEVGTPVLVSVEELARRADAYLYKPVEVHAVIVGKSDIYLVPIGKIVEVKTEDGEKEKHLKFFDLNNPQDSISLILSRKGDDIDTASLFILRIQDEAGFEKFTVYSVGAETHRSKRVIIRGIVVRLKTSRTFIPVLLSTEVFSANDVVDNFKVDSEKLKEVKPLRAEDYDQAKRIFDRILAPGIVGRSFEKLAAAVTQLSPLNIYYRDQEMQGTLKTIFFGDTGTGKSTIGKYLPEKLNLGTYATAETGSRAGLLYTVETTIEPPIVIWGQLVLADKEFACLDGFDKMGAEEYGEFRESLTRGKVLVSKRAKGEAPFRIRLIACANPTGKMNEYAYPVMAIRDIRPFRGRDAGASVRRFDLFIPFSEDDVDFEEIAEAKIKAFRDYEMEEKYRKLVLLAWSAKARFKEEALREAVNLAKKLIVYARSLDIPVIHNAFTDVVFKVCASFAVILQNFHIDGKGLWVDVDVKAVELAEKFFEEYIEWLGVKGYVENLSENMDPEKIDSVLSEVLKDGLLQNALLLLYKQKRSKRELGKKLGIKDHNKQQELVDRLKELEIAEAKPGKGIYLTRLGRIIAAKIINTPSRQDGLDSPQTNFPRPDLKDNKGVNLEAIIYSQLKKAGSVSEEIMKQALRRIDAPDKEKEEALKKLEEGGLVKRENGFITVDGGRDNTGDNTDLGYTVEYLEHLGTVYVCKKCGSYFVSLEDFEAHKRAGCNNNEH